MATTPVLPDALSAEARAFCEREHGLLIGGEWVAPADGTRFETLDPATAQPIASIAQAGEADVDAGAWTDGRGPRQGARTIFSASRRSNSR